MCGRLLAIIFIGLALLLAILASILPQDKLTSIIYISRFFDVMIPVLAVGALIKYLCSHKWCHPEGTHTPVNVVK
jgi:hypothetical protein